MKKLTHNDIEQLLQRFMDGQTTLDEEAQLAQYFRSTDVPAEWRDYQQMFAWFDKGMPEAQPEEPQKRTNLWLWLSVAAAVGLLIFTLQPWEQALRPSANYHSVAPLTAKADTATADTQTSDTLTAPRQQPARPKRKAKRLHFSPAPPTVYYAEHKPSTAQPEISKAANGDQQSVAARIAGMEQEQQTALETMQQRAGNMQQAIETMLRAQELETALAMEELLDDSETEDDELW